MQTTTTKKTKATKATSITIADDETQSIGKGLTQLQMAINEACEKVKPSVNDGSGSSHNGMTAQGVRQAIGEIANDHGTSQAIEIALGLALFYRESGHSLKVKENRDELTQVVSLHLESSRAIAYRIVLAQVGIIRARNAATEKMLKEIANYTAVRMAQKRAAKSA